jgi:type IV pilus biogenesis protein CpaD/CtpE
MKMKKILLVSLMGLLAACAVKAQVTVVDAPCEQLQQRVVTPKKIPATVEDVFTATVFIEEIVLTNPTATARLVTISDKQTSAQEILVVTVPAYGVVHQRFGCRYAPSGVTWVAAAATVVGYMRVRK